MPVRKDIQIVTAPSILGLKPTGVEQSAKSLLSHDLLDRLHAQKHIVEATTLNHLYSFVRTPGSILNEEALRNFSISLSKTILALQSPEKFLLVLGGDCSILIGIMLALKLKGVYGLFFLDAHADFYEPERSPTGEAADMDLALVTGRGPDRLTNINGVGSYVKDQHVVHLGQRDAEETQHYNARDIRKTPITCFDASFIQANGVDSTIGRIKEKLTQIPVDGFWIHFDADVIADHSNPAVDYRLPGGLALDECQALLRSLLVNYNILGMTVTIYNPALDPDAKVSGNITKLLCEVLG